MGPKMPHHLHLSGTTRTAIRIAPVASTLDTSRLMAATGELDTLCMGAGGGAGHTGPPLGGKPRTVEGKGNAHPCC